MIAEGVNVEDDDDAAAAPADASQVLEGAGVADDAEVAAFESAAAASAAGEGDSPELTDLNGDDDDDDWDGVAEVLKPPQWYVNREAIVEARGRFKRHELDTGSPDYQIAALTVRINYLTTHLRSNPKDFSTTRGLLKLVGKRRRLLKYLKREDPTRFKAVLEGMSIRVSQELRSM
jgi:small subunit ribosomal protein S15